MDKYCVYFTKVTVLCFPREWLRKILMNITVTKIQRCVVVVGPTPPPKKGGGVQQLFLRTPADGISPSNRRPGPLVDWWPLYSTSRYPTSTGAVHKSVTCSCVFMFVQLNMCVVVCGPVLQRGHSGDG